MRVTVGLYSNGYPKPMMNFWSWLKARFTPPRASVPASPAGAQVVAVMNRSTLVTDESLRSYVDALQIQVTRDFVPTWCPEKSYTLMFVGKKEQAPRGSWQIAVLDNADMAGVLGYHETTSDGDPLGKVFAAADIRYGCAVSVTLSHELLEMLGDPSADATKTGPEGLEYAYEACDPCEDDAYGYRINGVLVSDFVLPGYFVKSGAGPYDYKGYITKPFQLLSGGYQSTFDGNSWSSTRAERVNPLKASRREFKPIEGSRRWKRSLSKNAWRKSKGERA